MAAADRADPQGGETPKERLNRELDQLLQELRVALPGVQVLLAFLLTAPFTDRFHELSASGRNVYFGAVTLGAAASVLMIAPTVHHRLRFRDDIKEQMIQTANLLAIGGTACLAAAMGAAVYVAGEAAFPDSAPRWIGAGVVVLAAAVWFVLPFAFHRRDRSLRLGSAASPAGSPSSADPSVTTTSTTRRR